MSEDKQKIRIKDFLTARRAPLHEIFGQDVVDEMVAKDREIGRLTKLVNELVDFLWVESQGFALNPSDTDIVAKVRSQISFFSPSALSKNICLEFYPASEHLFVFADIPSLGKILGALLLNAIKYAEKYVRIDLSADRQKALLRVANDGVTILPEYAEKVFMPFMENPYWNGEDISRSIRIGIPLARDLARKNSGDLILENAGNKGTCFLLTLPISDPSREEEAVSAESGKHDNFFLEQFKKFVMDNLDSDLSNETLASELGMSQSTLIRKIKKMLGTTPGNYVSNCRLAAAAGYLKKNSDASITEVCYSVGFTSVSYFAKCFKDRYGVTPKAYATGK